MEEKPDSLSHSEASHLEVSRPERRTQPRYAADHDAAVLLVNHGSTLPGHMLELSLGGCRLRMARRFRAGIQIRVEVAFKINGIAFRLSGVTQWTDGDQTVGIRFGQMSSRRTAELVEVLAEMEADQAAREAKAEGERLAADPLPGESPVAEPVLAQKGASAGLEPKRLIQERQVGERHVGEGPVEGKLAQVTPAEGKLAMRGSPDNGARIGATVQAEVTGSLAKPHEVSRLASPRWNAPTPQPGAPTVVATAHDVAEKRPETISAPHPSHRERRQQARHSVDTTATIYFIDVAARAKGRILDVSMGGCRIRTDERFPVGIYRRVETEFRIDGLPFRLGGVVQSLHDKFTVGIRFLNLSERKSEQLGQLMEEIDEMRQEGTFDSR